MSLYNMLHGMNAQLAVLLTPFLPMPVEEFPRFRDVFTSDEDDPTGGEADIFIYCRMGGGNSECWEDNEPNCSCPACEADLIEAYPECIERYDDDFDSTYCTFCFKVPSEWETDYLALSENRLIDLSEKYWLKINTQYTTSDKVIEFIAQLRESIKNTQSKDNNEKA